MTDPADTPAPPPAPATPKPRRRRHWMWHASRAVALTCLLVVALLIAAGLFLTTEVGLAVAVRILVARSDGQLQVEGATGSLLSTVRAKRIAWKGATTTVSAEDVALNWSPIDLWARGIVVKGLGAQRIDIAMQASDQAVPLPATLALPTEVTIDEIAVAKLDWRVGKNGGSITGLSFGYRGGAARHRVSDLAFVTQSGALTGAVDMDATLPYKIEGSFLFVGDHTFTDARADAKVTGTLDSIGVDAAGRARDASFTLRAGLRPLAAVVLERIALDAQGLDLSTWHVALPATRLNLTATAHPTGDGLAGELEATNANPGPVDTQRVPLRTLRSRFSWHENEVALDALALELTGNGRATGSASIPLTGNAGKWTLEVRDLDLKQVHTALVTTRLSGTLGADLDASRQRIEGNVADRGIVGGIGLAFAAVVAERRVTVERFRLSAGDGELSGSGRMDIANDQAFDVRAKARHVDPSRYGAFPAGSLDGDVAVSGALQPQWRANASVTLTEGSKLSGVPLAGTARAAVTAHTVRDAAIDMKLGAAHLTASGSAGGGDDRLNAVLDAPQLADIAPLLPPRVPRPLGGSLHATLDLRGDLERGAIAIEAKGQALKLGNRLSLASLDAHASIAAAASAASARFADRALKIEIGATDLVAPQGSFPRAKASVEGTLARHTATLAFAGEDLDLDATAHGSLRETSASGGGWAWSGSLDTLENRGPWAVRLSAPATLEVAADRVRIGAARLLVADGNVELASLAWDNGRIDTRGSFSRVPAATVAKLAGLELPFQSTLTIAGDWSLAAAPRLNGAVHVRREDGDIYVGAANMVEPGDRAVGITAIDVAATFRDDAVDATATLRTRRGADIEARLALGVPPGGPSGRLAPDAPLHLTVQGNLQSLRVLQPWVGTTAVVDGRARIDLKADGTLADAPLSGTLHGEALRIEAPQFGVFLTSGRLNATLAKGTVMLEELSFVGGAGSFTASGTLAKTGDVRFDGQGAAAQITWRAEKFRVLNRPDMRLVVDGSGTLGLKDRRISLSGTLTAEEGHIEYSDDPGSQLSSDVVVKGWPARSAERSGIGNLPLALDLDLDLGNRLTFTGEGLETGLRGKVHVSTGSDGVLRGSGAIRAVNGTYYAFGQKLVIDRGRLIFDGPLNNPGLDIVALRKNLAVEAGVAVSGTVRVPIIQLTSNPPVPDNEKLSWLVLGQGLDRSSGADYAALQAASAALLGRGGKPMTTTVAQSIGLDDISVHSSSAVARNAAAGAPEATGQVVAFGKRLTDKLSLVYEQGLTVATNALRLEYALTRTLTLRAEAGTISGFGVYYRRTFE